MMEKNEMNQTGENGTNQPISAKPKLVLLKYRFRYLMVDQWGQKKKN